MKTYTPHVAVVIPADIPATNHAVIHAKAEEINQRLQQFGGSKASAIERAAIAAHNSGIGACLIPQAR